MLDKIISLFSEEPSADAKAATFAEILEALFAYILEHFMGIAPEAE